MEAARRANLAAAGAPMPVAGAAGATRRAVLKALGASGVAGLAPLPAAAARPRRVAIIGGGIAGLSALWYLTQAGVDAHLYEARARMGGRMFTWRRFAGDQPVEDGGQLVNTDHADMHALVKAFDIALVDRKAGNHRLAVIADGAPLDDAALAEALRPIAAQIGRDADQLDKDYARVAAEIDRLSIADYLDRHAALMPTPWVRRLLESTSRTEYGVEPARASALELLFNLPTVDGQRTEILSSSDERFLMQGGSGALIDAMVARLGDRIATGKRCARIAPAPGGVRIGFLDGTMAEADAAIVAVPAPLTRTIDYAVPLPPRWRQFIDVMELGRCEKINMAVDPAAWDRVVGRGGELWETDAGSPYALAWNGGVAGGSVDVITWFLGGDQVGAAADGDPAALAAGYAAHAGRAVPGLAPAGPSRRTAWHRDSLTLGGYANFPPGQLSRFGALLWTDDTVLAKRQVAGGGRLFFAGEHLSDAYPGYMNGAAQTGRMAAEALVGRTIA